MWEDPLVAEVRRVRDAYAAQYGYDLTALYQALKAQEAQEMRPKVTFPPQCVALAPEQPAVPAVSSVA